MEVVDICRNGISLRNVRVVLVCRACESICVSDALCLLKCLVSPNTCIKVCSLVLKEVHSYIQELKAGATAEEYHLMSIRNVKQLFPVRADLVHHFAPLFGTV